MTSRLPSRPALRRFSLLALLATLLLPASAWSQQRSQQNGETPPDTMRFEIDGLTVTATRSERPVFTAPVPAATVQGLSIWQLQPRSASETLIRVPGVDVSGVGGRQARPVIRGMRGQRILLLADGLRLNNARRQQDFGELPALASVSELSRVEVVKGPASVLYGTDAIGGVVNMVSREPTEDGVRASGGLRYGSAQDEFSARLGAEGRSGRWSWNLSGRMQEASAYEAPSGSFGSIDLANPALVQGTGSKEWGGRAGVAFSPAEGHRFHLKGSYSSADESGFGYVDPALYAEGQPVIDITYPEQTFSRTQLGYEGTSFDRALLDRLDVRLYRQTNERDLRFEMNQSFGPPAPPGAGLELITTNHTDVETLGFRVEAKKLAGTSTLFTYGIDGFRDRSDNTDLLVSTVTGFGPPQVDTDATPQLPNATYDSYGLFAQTEVELGDFTLTVGGRGQRVAANTRATEGLSAADADRSEWTLVGAVNGLYRLTDDLVVLGSVGRGFRAPNLVELFFEGPVAEAGAYQSRSSSLEAERSLSVDLGVRYRGDRVAVEALVFNNDLDGGIRAAPTGDSIAGLPEFRNVNLEELRYQGAEAAVEVLLGRGFSTGGSFTWITSEDRLDPDNPVGDTFDRRGTAHLSYQTDRGVWGRFDVRRNGERKDVDLGTNPLGAVLPAFTVMDLSAGFAIDQWGAVDERVVVRIENLTDELYAEFPNAAFFRPAPGRRLVLGLEFGF